MIELEVFERDSPGLHNVSIWVKSSLVYGERIFNNKELKQFRDELASELKWLDDYLRERNE